MKKLSLLVTIAALSISLVSCTNSGGVNNSNNDSSNNSSVQSKTSNKITIDEAKEIALKHAGLTKDQVSFIETENEVDNGAEKYDIGFYYNGKEYDYEISAIDGKIIKYDNDIDEGNNQNNTANSTQNNTQSNTQNNTVNKVQSNTNNTTGISGDKAKEIALNHAGLTSSQVNFKRTELDYDDGIQKYEVEFYYNNKEYSYEIDANNGNILSYEQD